MRNSYLHYLCAFCAVVWSSQCSHHTRKGWKFVQYCKVKTHKVKQSHRVERWNPSPSWPRENENSKVLSGEFWCLKNIEKKKKVAVFFLFFGLLRMRRRKAGKSFFFVIVCWRIGFGFFWPRDRERTLTLSANNNARLFLGSK